MPSFISLRSERTKQTREIHHLQEQLCQLQPWGGTVSPSVPKQSPKSVPQHPCAARCKIYTGSAIDLEAVHNEW